MDLHRLLTGVFRGTGPAHFLCLERDAVAVAKTRVILSMLASAETPEDLVHVAQVWWSSSWSPACDRAFTKAVERVMIAMEESGEGQETGSEFPSPLSILRHWLSTPVSLAEARRGWDRLHGSGNWGSHFKLWRAEDVESLAVYELSGDVFFSSRREERVGSRTMHGCPDGCPPSSTDESILASVPLRELPGGKGGVMARVEMFFVLGLARLKGHLSSWMSVEARVGDITRPELSAAVAAMDP
eukprot:gnl/Dysnectes_brevis/1569_a1779_1105.p2 GENE.gnl/Dysnectes_brevis/1569_a1779_1105~~gnl/Dysnectes_brevis/1569_a1779_1105.p2  ORF type:complete len:243 (-),score=82.43 gnl/Dysnectes_brevis/1569_a1779_1105:2214-2942(-)